jgi:uncharacterized membrane protein YjfL (UPF0719 family)
MKLDQLGDALLTTAAFAALGVIAFAAAFWLMVRISPFSVRKEIEDDQNTSLAILMGSVIIGLALVIAAAVHG